ncbi:hypothetical protein MAPG_10913 [Magnaporthiopsis poae ATCC 64411]|uniref:Uncharacterized protein n=1 Tax=Magnaporthiopsis poae (strain ATCC 64411 / 73-15) TaxID=644358 RepID=A0A0C4EDV2_MAGP6|nr:hypothetical protein MAPG_10913 [Magnaporthiopsis poae ATCC 64411]
MDIVWGEGRGLLSSFTEPLESAKRRRQEAERLAGSSQALNPSNSHVVPRWAIQQPARILAAHSPLAPTWRGCGVL